MPKVSRGRRRFGAKVDTNLDGKEILKSGTDRIEIWPKYCVRYFHCLQCDIEGRIQCAPRFRTKEGASVT